MKLTEAQRTALVGLLDWYFASIEIDVKASKATAKAPVVPRISDEYQADADSDAPALTSEQHAARMRGLQHVDASASGSVPADFVPTSAMNNRPTANGSKTDAAMVKRI